MPTLKQMADTIKALEAKLAVAQSKANGALKITEGEFNGAKTLTYSGPFFKRIGVRGNAQLIVHQDAAMRQCPALAEAVEQIRDALKAP